MSVSNRFAGEARLRPCMCYRVGPGDIRLRFVRYWRRLRRRARGAACCRAWLRAAIAEEYRFGGTCVIRGCVPKKLFVYASELGHAIDDAKGFGWTVTGKSFDWKTLIANKDAEIERLSKLYAGGVEKAGGTVIRDRAEVVGPNAVKLVREDRTVTAERILIATGGYPFIPEIPGRELAITSNEAFHLEALPDKIVIVGAGYIAMEFAGIFHGLGVEVEVMYRGSEILRGFDQDLRHALAETMRAQGITITYNTEPAAIEQSGGRLVAVTADGRRIPCGAIMFAAGRRPNTLGLGLQKLGVECGWNGRIAVDDWYRSSVPSIYAVGDVTDRVNLTPVAIRDAIAFIEANYKNNPNPVDLAFLPAGGIFPARNRHRGLHRRARPRDVPRGGHLQIELPAAEAHAVRSARAHADETRGGCRNR